MVSNVNQLTRGCVSVNNFSGSERFICFEIVLDISVKERSEFNEEHIKIQGRNSPQKIEHCGNGNREDFACFK